MNVSACEVMLIVPAPGVSPRTQVSFRPIYQAQVKRKTPGAGRCDMEGSPLCFGGRNVLDSRKTLVLTLLLPPLAPRLHRLHDETGSHFPYTPAIVCAKPRRGPPSGGLHSFQGSMLRSWPQGRGVRMFEAAREMCCRGVGGQTPRQRGRNRVFHVGCVPAPAWPCLQPPCLLTWSLIGSCRLLLRDGPGGQDTAC